MGWHQPKVFSSEPQTPIQQYQDQHFETDETEMFKKIQIDQIGSKVDLDTPQNMFQVLAVHICSRLPQFMKDQGPRFSEALHQKRWKK